MRKYIIILFACLSWFAKGQDYNFQDLCLTCAESQGYYCGDDPANWTQYAPEGCVQTAWLNEVYYNEKGKKINSEFVDEGQLSKVKKDHNGRRFVVEDDTNRKLYLSKEYAPQTQRK